MRVAAINDLSGLGKCSLIADISVLSVMGIQTCPITTAVLSAQTGFPSYCCEDLTGIIPKVKQEWTNMGLSFDGILTGFMMSENQALNVLDFIKCFKKEGTKVLVDPVMGDDGKVYANYTPELLEIMKKMVDEADIITPNITELCILADTDPREIISLEGEEMADNVYSLVQKVRNREEMTVVVTGISMEQGSVMGNLVVTDECNCLIKSSANKVHYSGTGDLFAAVLLGGMLQGRTAVEASELAGKFIYESVKDTEKLGTDSREGVEYERHLGMLIY